MSESIVIPVVVDAKGVDSELQGIAKHLEVVGAKAKDAASAMSKGMAGAASEAGKATNKAAQQAESFGGGVVASAKNAAASMLMVAGKVGAVAAGFYAMGKAIDAATVRLADMSRANYWGATSKHIASLQDGMKGLITSAQAMQEATALRQRGLDAGGMRSFQAVRRAAVGLGGMQADAATNMIMGGTVSPQMEQALGVSVGTWENAVRRITVANGGAAPTFQQLITAMENLIPKTKAAQDAINAAIPTQPFTALTNALSNMANVAANEAASGILLLAKNLGSLWGSIKAILPKSRNLIPTEEADKIIAEYNRRTAPRQTGTVDDLARIGGTTAELAAMRKAEQQRQADLARSEAQAQKQSELRRIRAAQAAKALQESLDAQLARQAQARSLVREQLATMAGDMQPLLSQATGIASIISSLTDRYRTLVAQYGVGNTKVQEQLGMLNTQLTVQRRNLEVSLQVQRANVEASATTVATERIRLQTSAQLAASQNDYLRERLGLEKQLGLLERRVGANQLDPASAAHARTALQDALRLLTQEYEVRRKITVELERRNILEAQLSRAADVSSQFSAVAQLQEQLRQVRMQTERLTLPRNGMLDEGQAQLLQAQELRAQVLMLEGRRQLEQLKAQQATTPEQAQQARDNIALIDAQKLAMSNLSAAYMTQAQAQAAVAASSLSVVDSMRRMGAESTQHTVVVAKSAQAMFNAVGTASQGMVGAAQSAMDALFQSGSAKDAMKAFGAGLLGAAGDVAIQLAAFYAALGAAEIATVVGIPKGIAMIAAATGLGIVGAGLKAASGVAGRPSPASGSRVAGITPSTPRSVRAGMMDTSGVASSSAGTWRTPNSQQPVQIFVAVNEEPWNQRSDADRFRNFNDWAKAGARKTGVRW